MTPVTDEFADRAYVVTGGASGIGLATVRMLLDHGASVSVIDTQPMAAATEIAGHADKSADHLHFLSADVADSAQVDGAIAAAVERFGRLDGLVCSAGVRIPRMPAIELDDSAWDRVLAVNLRGTFAADRAAARIFAGNGGGSIVNVASISGKAARAGQIAYGVSKAAVIHLGRILALELAKDHIRVNTVCPGVTDTPMIRGAQDQDGDQLINERIYGSTSDFRPGIPLRRIAMPEDPAAAIFFLLSAGAAHITGQELVVDGGETLI
jgi:NAD(P)-dependent dehydrogenase (short-subunit alcohol dehydrogenase family)